MQISNFKGGPNFGGLTIIAHDEQRKCPAWVAYRFSGDIQFTDHKRLGFKVDERTEARIRDENHTNSGYDRDHMAPSFGI